MLKWRVGDVIAGPLHEGAVVESIREDGWLVLDVEHPLFRGEQITVGAGDYRKRPMPDRWLGHDGPWGFWIAVA